MEYCPIAAGYMSGPSVFLLSIKLQQNDRSSLCCVSVCLCFRPAIIFLCDHTQTHADAQPRRRADRHADAQTTHRHADRRTHADRRRHTHADIYTRTQSTAKHRTSPYSKTIILAKQKRLKTEMHLSTHTTEFSLSFSLSRAHD